MVVVVRVCAMGRVLRAMVFLRALGIARGLGECRKVANGRGAQGGDKFRPAITRLLPLPPIVRQLARHRRIISRIRRTPRIFEFFSPLASQIYFDHTVNAEAALPLQLTDDRRGWTIASE